jgi:hypothetical protein
MNSPATSPASARWIVGARADALIFFGMPALALALGLAVLAQPLLLVPLFWAWLLLIDGPHLAATGLRSFLDPARAAHEAAWRRRAWLPFVLPMSAFALAQWQPAWRTMDLLLAIGVLYSWYHLTRQHEGILAIYHAQTGGRGIAPERRWLKAWLWSAFALAAVATPANRTIWLGEVPPATAAQLTPWLNALAVVLAIVTAGFVLAYLREGVHRARTAQSLRPWWFGLLPVGALSTIALLGIGWFEPLFVAPGHPEQYFLAVTMMTGVLHGTQYLGIVLAANRRRYEGDAAAAHWAARLSRRPAAALALAIVASGTLYLVLNASRASLPGLSWFDLDAPLAQFAFALYWGVFFHHYYVDNKIWRVRSDAALRSELAIA